MLARLLLEAAPSPEPTSTLGPDCAGSNTCQWMYDLTHSVGVAQSSYWIIVKPLRVLGIVLLAMLLRFLLQRAISRLVRTTSNGSVPTVLKPLRRRMNAALLQKATNTTNAANAVPERRRQRAEAIGSVLRSFVTAAVFSVALLLVMGELGFNLGPLLASAGIVGLALGFGAQSLVKDLLAGLFMLLEDQYGVGDTVDVGEATGVVESVGLRITTIRDGRGVLWYIRNGEIVRVGNKSQGWAMVIVDMPIGFAGVEEATAVLREAATTLAAEPEYADHFIDPPDVLGVEQITVDGAVVRTTARTTADGQFPVARELRRRLAEALDEAGITARLAAGRSYPRPAVPPAARPPEPDTEDGPRPGGPT